MARLDRQPRPAAVSDDQTPQQVAAPRYIRFTCQTATNSFLPAIAGADETSDLVLAMRFAPEASSRDENFSALRPDLRQRMPAVGAGSLTISALSHDVRKKEKGSGTPNNAGRYQPHLSMRRALCKARSPFGVPPRLCANGTIHPKAQPGPGFVTQRPNAAGSPPAGVALPAMHLARRS